jgi:hypothetical protein
VAPYSPESLSSWLDDEWPSDRARHAIAAIVADARRAVGRDELWPAAVDPWHELG